MSGTYKIDDILFLDNPLAKQWQREQAGVNGVGLPLYSQYWTLDLSFSFMAIGSGTTPTFLMEKFLENTLHTAVLPHPQHGFLATFSNINIKKVDFNFTEFERDTFVDGLQITLTHLDVANAVTLAGQQKWIDYNIPPIEFEPCDCEAGSGTFVWVDSVPQGGGYQAGDVGNCGYSFRYSSYDLTHEQNSVVKFLLPRVAGCNVVTVVCSLYTSLGLGRAYITVDGVDIEKFAVTNCHYEINCDVGMVGVVGLEFREECKGSGVDCMIDSVGWSYV